MLSPTSAVAGAATLIVELTIPVAAGGGAPVAEPTVIGMPAGEDGGDGARRREQLDLLVCVRPPESVTSTDSSRCEG